MTAQQSTFPFLWGAATSSHQVEGHNRHNDWWAAEQAGRLAFPSGAACDQYHRFPQDFELISQLGHTAHRFSLEWSRFEPAENQWNEAAFQHYRKIFEDLKSRNIEPVVTLHHFTNPEWLARKGGWLNPEVISLFRRYTAKVVEAFGPYVRFWMTINEPLVYLFHSHSAGTWPPFGHSLGECKQVFRHFLHAHVEAYRTIHQHYETVLHRPVWVSIAQHMSDVTPCRAQSWGDRFGAWLRREFGNSLFVEAAMSGFLFFPGVFCEFLSANRTLDYLGINYYTRDFVRFDGFFHLKSISEACPKDHHLHEIQERNSLGWEVYPEGLYHVLIRAKRFGIPVMISENGICTEDDTQRQRFIVQHLDSVVRARKAGVPIWGYFYWSLLDNFEWHHGFSPRFGIVEVNYLTQERKIRKSAQVLGDICRIL